MCNDCTYTFPVSGFYGGFKFIHPFGNIGRKHTLNRCFLEHAGSIRASCSAAVFLLLNKVDLVESRKSAFQIFCGFVGFIKGFCVILLHIYRLCKGGIASEFCEQCAQHIKQTGYRLYYLVYYGEYGLQSRKQHSCYTVFDISKTALQLGHGGVGLTTGLHHIIHTFGSSHDHGIDTSPYNHTRQYLCHSLSHFRETRSDIFYFGFNRIYSLAEYFLYSSAYFRYDSSDFCFYPSKSRDGLAKLLFDCPDLFPECIELTAGPFRLALYLLHFLNGFINTWNPVFIFFPECLCNTLTTIIFPKSATLGVCLVCISTGLRFILCGGAYPCRRFLSGIGGQLRPTYFISSCSSFFFCRLFRRFIGF